MRKYVIADYINGNVHITLFNDGTRIMESEDDEFRFDMPTNVDMQITTVCDQYCPYCYANCSESGRHAELVDSSVVDSLGEFQELAINLNNMVHPQLAKFLKAMKKKHVFVNGTINQAHFMKYHKELKSLCDSEWIWGLGISLQKPTDEFIEIVKTFPNAVVHTICGVLTAEDIEKLRDNDIKLLILGYKNIGRGVDYMIQNETNIEARRRYLKDNLPSIINHFKVVSFDNLALEQLDVKNTLKINDENWEEMYQGDEGSSTFYIDLVNKKYGISSLCSEKEMHPIGDLTVKEMFENIKEEARKLNGGN